MNNNEWSWTIANDNERKLNVNVHEGQSTFEIWSHEEPVLYITKYLKKHCNKQKNIKILSISVSWGIIFVNNGCS